MNLIGNPDIRPYRGVRVLCAVLFALAIVPLTLHVHEWWQWVYPLAGWAGAAAVVWVNVRVIRRSPLGWRERGTSI
jgi:hypothetical protein